MTKVQKSRWEAAKKLFDALIYKAKLTSSDIWYDGSIIKPEQIVFTEDEILVVDGNSHYLQFSANPDWDEGMFTRQADYAKIVRENFKLVKFIRW